MEQTAAQPRELGNAAAGEIHCVTVIGQVEGHELLPDDAKTTKYEHILPLLAAIEEAPDIRGVLLLLNTVGGDVDAGLGIAEMIAGMRKPTASLILGGGHSIGVPMAIAAQRSFIAPSAAVTTALLPQLFVAKNLKYTKYSCAFRPRSAAKWLAVPADLRF